MKNFINKSIFSVRNGMVKLILGKSLAGLMRSSSDHRSELDVNVQLSTSEQLQAYADSSWVYACVSRVAQDLAALPIKLYTQKGDDQKMEIKDHAVLTVLQKINDQMTRYDFVEWLVSSLELSGNFYCGIVDRYPNNEPRELLPYNSSLVKPIPSKDPKILIEKYEYSVNGSAYPLSPEAMLHIKYFNPLLNGYIQGMSPLQAAALAYGTDKAASVWNISAIKNGTALDVVLESDRDVSDPNVRKEMIDSFTAKYSGPRNARKPALLTNGVKARPFGLNQKDMEFLNMRKMTREEICSIYRVPPALVGIYEYANYANSEQQEKFYWKNGILPRKRKIEACLNEKFLPQFKGTERMFLELDVSGVDILQDNQEQKINIAKVYFNMGAPYNAIAKAFNLPVKEIEGGDIGYLPFGLTPASSVNDQDTQTDPDAEKSKKKILKGKLNDKTKELKWKQFVKIADKFEARIKPVLNRFFLGQELEVQANLEKFKSIKAKINIDDIFFNMDDESKKLSKKMKGLYEQIMMQQAKQEIENFNFGINFDLTNPRVSDWVMKHGLDAAEGINQTTKDALRKALIEGIDTGESISDLSKRIGSVYDDAKGYRAERIARTETIAASNEGALESYRQTGLKVRKAWLSAMDERTRETHIAAAQEYDEKGAIGLDDNFYVGEGNGPAPAEISLPEESINCRCTIMPVMEE